MTTIDHLLNLRQTRRDAEDTLKARYSFEARIAYDNAARAFEYALNVAAEDLLKMVEAGQAHERSADAGLLAALETARDYVADTATGALVYADSGEGLMAMAKEDLARIDAAIAAAKGTDHAE